MTGRNGGPDGAVDRDGAHQQAAETFVRRVGDRDLPGLHRLILFGSSARGTASGLESDVDFLAVVADDPDLLSGDPVRGVLGPDPLPGV